MTNEAWLPVASYDGQYAAKYDVSSFGRVRRGNRYLTAFIGAKGYPQVCLAGRTVKVHKLVAETFIGLRPTSATQINHRDGDKTNNTVSNLEFCSALENIHHFKARLCGDGGGSATALGKMLLGARLSRNLSLRDAGKLTGVAYNRLCVFETQAASPHPKTVRRLADTYGLDLAALTEAAQKSAVPRKPRKGANKC